MSEADDRKTRPDAPLNFSASSKKEEEKYDDNKANVDSKASSTTGLPASKESHRARVTETVKEYSA